MILKQKRIIALFWIAFSFYSFYLGEELAGWACLIISNIWGSD